MTGVWSGLSAADRADAAVRALDRAQEATTTALGHLHRAGDVDWTGPGASRYRDGLATALDDVRLVRVWLRQAGAAARAHAAAVRDEAQLAAGAGWPPGPAVGFAAPAPGGAVGFAGPAPGGAVVPRGGPWPVP